MSDKTIAVIGLGYVGLPLAVAFGKKFPTVGFDLSREKIDSYKKHIDPAGDVPQADFEQATLLKVTANPEEIASADFLIVAVPTPIDQAHQPDLTPLVNASDTVGRHMKQGAVIIFESTVYPGVTEDVCIPCLEKASGMTWKTDFHVGYSPERINPGDKEHTLAKVIKVVSGDSEETLNTVADLYSGIVEAGVYKAKASRRPKPPKSSRTSSATSTSP